MPPEVGWMYTGPRVCSPLITPQDVLDWGKGSERAVVLWDNYPVNDAAMVNNLHLAPLTGRAAQLPSVARGYLFNPLLQADLGTLPGATCLAYAADPTGYDPVRAWNDALEAILPSEARQPLRELEALTRRCCLVDFPADDQFGDRGSLAARLEAGWLAMEEGRGGDSAAHGAGLSAHGGDLSVHVELGKILGALGASLPAAMLEQAQPWLERLRRAQQVFAARGSVVQGSVVEGPVVQSSAAADWSEAAASYRQGEAWVLGQWFGP